MSFPLYRRQQQRILLVFQMTSVKINEEIVYCIVKLSFRFFFHRLNASLLLWVKLNTFACIFTAQVTLNKCVQASK